VLGENARFLEQANRTVNRGDRNIVIDRRRAFVQRLDVGMVGRLRQYARDDATLVGPS